MFNLPRRAHDTRGFVSSHHLCTDETRRSFLLVLVSDAETSLSGSRDSLHSCVVVLFQVRTGLQSRFTKLVKSHGVYKMSTCLLTNIKATRHDLGLTSALVDLRERESWFFSTLSSLSSLSSHF